MHVLSPTCIIAFQLDFSRSGARIYNTGPENEGGGGHSAKFNFYFAAVRVKPLGRYLIPHLVCLSFVTLTMTFDLHLKNINFVHNYCTLWVIIFCIYVPCHSVMWLIWTFLIIWPWPWPLTYIWKFWMQFCRWSICQIFNKILYQSINLLDHIYSASNNCIIIYHRRRGTQRISWQWIKMHGKDTCINLQCHRYKWPQFLSESGIYKYPKCRYAFSTCITPSPNKSLFKKV